MAGSIRKKLDSKGKASYLVRVEYPVDPVTGNRKQRSRAVSTKRGAEKLLAEWLTDIERGTAVEPSRMTIGEYLAHWLETAARHQVRETTYLGYATTIHTHLIPGLGSVALQRLTPVQVQAFYADRLTAGHSAAVVGKCHSRLSQALKQAVRWQMVVRNACDAVDPPRVTHKQAQTWSRDEARAFLAEAEHDNYHPYWLLALTTGMRRGELLGLRWQDVDFERHRVQILQTVTVGAKGVPIFQEPKTPKARRMIPIPSVVTAALKAHRTAQKITRLAAGAWHDHDLVFCVEGGGPINPSNVLRNSHAISKRAGVPLLNIHAMRHTHATLLLQDGQNVKVVQERLGHASITLTLSTYAHSMPAMREAAAESIGALLTGNSANAREPDVNLEDANEKTVG